MAVPVTLALTLLLTYLFGYTLNRVTLFALIFSIGILVDDAIVVVENIHRHLHLPGAAGAASPAPCIDAVDEVGNPTILATFAVIAAILPMAFVRGLMGPYMRPIPVGASVAMLFSLVIAFVVTPWAALRVFRKEAHLPRRTRPGCTRRIRDARRAGAGHDPLGARGERPEGGGWPPAPTAASCRCCSARAAARWAFLGGVGRAPAGRHGAGRPAAR